MEEKLDVKKYGVTVRYNHKVLVADRKKTRIIEGIVIFICALGFAGLTVVSALAKKTAIWVPIVFGAVSLFAFVYSFYYFFTVKASKKDENRRIKFDFYENSLVINQSGRKEGKDKLLENCLYRKNGNYQYVTLVTEFKDRFQIKIRVGSYNGMPRYKTHVLPKSIFKNETLTRFTAFLKEKVGVDYIVK